MELHKQVWGRAANSVVPALHGTCHAVSAVSPVSPPTRILSTTPFDKNPPVCAAPFASTLAGDRTSTLTHHRQHSLPSRLLTTKTMKAATTAFAHGAAQLSAGADAVTRELPTQRIPL